jgi:hypothetical protein
MFTIDLLKGRGIPARNRPEGVVAAAVAMAMPIVVTILLLGFFISNKVMITVRQRELTNCVRQADGLTEAVALQHSFEAEKTQIASCMAEAATAINRHMQWSDILVALVKNLPDPLVLTQLSVNEQSARVKVADKNDPDRKIDVFVPTRTLNVSLGGSSESASDRAVRDFRDRLRLANALAHKIEDIPVSQEVGIEDDREVATYEMKCIFKPQI